MLDRWNYLDVVGSSVAFESVPVHLSKKPTTVFIDAVEKDEDGLSNLLNAVMEILSRKGAAQPKDWEADSKINLKCMIAYSSVEEKYPEIRDLVFERWDDSNKEWATFFGMVYGSGLIHVRDEAVRKKLYLF